MPMGKDLLSSITGNVDKACLVIKDYRALNNGNLNPLGAITKTKTALSGGVNKLVTNVVGQNDKKMMVQFNPSELQIYAMGDVYHKADTRKSETDKQQVSEMATRPRVDLTVNLYFDAVNLADSFMMEKFTTFASAQAVNNVISMVRGKVWSVQPQVEGLVAALRNPYTRTVGFHWSTFSFEGQLVNVSAQYMMFSTSGRPVRARVTLRLRQELDPDKLQSWFKDFNSAFAGTGARMSGLGQTMGNLINLG